MERVFNKEKKLTKRFKSEVVKEIVIDYLNLAEEFGLEQYLKSSSKFSSIVRGLTDQELDDIGEALERKIRTILKVHFKETS